MAVEVGAKAASASLSIARRPACVAALPAETRAAVMAGTAVERGRGFLELEAAAELVRAPATCTCT